MTEYERRKLEHKIAVLQLTLDEYKLTEKLRKLDAEMEEESDMQIKNLIRIKKMQLKSHVGRMRNNLKDLRKSKNWQLN